MIRRYTMHGPLRVPTNVGVGCRGKVHDDQRYDGAVCGSLLTFARLFTHGFCGRADSSEFCPCACG
jgi:hypothetical protein